MTRAELLAFLRNHKLAVQASVAPGGAPQAAVVGVAFSDALEIVFDTVDSSRKFKNLRADPRIALVVGWDEEVTAQIEGLAEFPTGAERDRARECYFVAYPDGRERLGWPGITHVLVRPIWVRYTDFRPNPPLIIEFAAAQLR